MDLLMDHLGKGLWLALMLSMPAVLTAAAIGLVVGILQAVTQVQEQTIAAAPKIMGVFLLLIFGGGVMLNILTDYIRESFHLAFEEIPQTGQFLLKPQTPHQKFFDSQLSKFDSGKAKAMMERPSTALHDEPKR